MSVRDDPPEERIKSVGHIMDHLEVSFFLACDLDIVKARIKPHLIQTTLQSFLYIVGNTTAKKLSTSRKRYFRCSNQAAILHGGII